MLRIAVAKYTLLDILSEEESFNSQLKTMVHDTKLKEDAKGLIRGQNFTLSQYYRL